MKYIFAAGILASLAVAQPAAASTYLNIPAASARIFDVGYACQYFPGTMAITPQLSTKDCGVEFSLPIPAGHTIRQISVFHSCTEGLGSCTASSYKVQAQLTALYIAGTASNTLETKFPTSTPWQDPGVINVMKLMAASGSSYPDSFVVLAGKQYGVFVSLSNPNTELRGIQVIYD